MTKKHFKKDFSHKHYQNPFFYQVKEASKKRRAVTIKIIGAFTTVGWVWFLVFSPFLKITNVAISAPDENSKKTVENLVSAALSERRWLFFPANSIFVANDKTIEKRISDFLPAKIARARKKYPNTLEIFYEPRTAWALVITDAAAAKIDKEGIVISIQNNSDLDIYNPKKSTSSTARDVALNRLKGISSAKNKWNGPVIYTVKINKVEYKHNLLAENETKLITRLDDELSIKIAEDIFYYELDDRDNVNAVTKSGARLLFSKSADISEQIQKLSLVVKNQIGERFSQIDYIDARVAGRIFYKFLE